MIKKAFKLICLSLFLIFAPLNLRAEISKLAQITGVMEQGGLIIGKTQPNALIKLEGKKLPLSADGFFIAGFGRDDALEQKLEVIIPNQQSETVTLNIKKIDWNIQKINGLPQQKVSPDIEAQKRIEEENKKIRKAREEVSKETWFLSGFTLPAHGPISGVFGSQRILNGEPRAPHSGVDYAAPKGSDVLSFADGKVVLVHQDMFYTGKTIMINHGLGLVSVYAHLEETLAKEGDMVKKGQKIGTVGATGRATGPHLHFGLSVGNTRINPEAALNL